MTSTATAPAPTMTNTATTPTQCIHIQIISVTRKKYLNKADCPVKDYLEEGPSQAGPLQGEELELEVKDKEDPSEGPSQVRPSQGQESESEVIVNPYL